MVRIADVIELCFSLNHGGGNRPPMIAVVCFWDTSCNTFDFSFGQMSITLLELYAITGLPIAEKQYAHTMEPTVPIEFAFDLPRPEITKSYGAWVSHYSQFEDDRGGLAFLQLWLLKYIECSTTNKPTNNWVRIAQLLYQGVRINLLSMTLGMLYRALYTLPLSPFNHHEVSGPLWILDIWLQLYFPRFRNPKLELVSSNKVLGMSFAGLRKFHGSPYS
ncbi:PREDICTED: uncharacterized protein LOC101293838 isoform 2 [Fragaria vesca subsp. vesca]|uniref:uncharacterized protein LOC105349242 n=1 Tax=Fragaria vesca subsp. vesca TaxID=101020 RepID=UPI0002C34E03|nr:PREDICTED: uncharacterized protein LOC105349242 [Fragaria vesca subsp. vesca]